MTKQEVIDNLHTLIRIISPADFGNYSESLHAAIELLSSSLPLSNLDEAATWYVKCQHTIPYTDKDLHVAFKAGAEWMVRQGETRECY